MTTRGEVRRDGATYRLVLESHFDAKQDVRSFESHTCSALADAAAVFLAIALEPGLDASLPDPPASSEPDAETPSPLEEPSSTERPPLESPPPRRPSRPPHGTSVAPPPTTPAEHADEPPDASLRPSARELPFASLRAGVGIDYGVLDLPMLAVVGGVSVAWTRLELGIDGLYLAPRRRPREGPGGLYQGFGGGVRGCMRFAGVPVEVPVCLGVEAGAARGEARGLTTASGVRWGPWARPYVSTGVAQRRRWGGWWVMLQVGIGAYRTGFRIGGETALDAELLSVRLAAGGTIDFRHGR